MKNRLEEEEKALAAVDNQLGECDSTVEKLTKVIATKNKQKETLAAKAEEAKEHLESLQRQLQGLSAGIAEEGSKSLSDMLLDLKTKAQEASTSSKQAGTNSL